MCGEYYFASQIIATKNTSFVTFLESYVRLMEESFKNEDVQGLANRHWTKREKDGTKEMPCFLWLRTFLLLFSCCRLISHNYNWNRAKILYILFNLGFTVISFLTFLVLLDSRDWTVVSEELVESIISQAKLLQGKKPPRFNRNLFRFLCVTFD